MNNYGTPPLALVRGRGRRGVGRRRPPLPGPGRRDRGERARPRAPGRARGGHARSSHSWATCPTSTWPSRRSRWPRSWPSWWTRRPTPRCERCSATPARRPTRRRSRSPGGPAGRSIIAAENAFHGRTMGALALTGQQPKRTPFEPMTPGVDPRALRRPGRAGRGRRRRHRRGVPRADPGRGRGGHPAAGLPGRRPGRSPPRAARCWCSTRCRPASAAPAPGSPSSGPASCPTWSRWPRAWAAACRSAPASASGAAGELLEPGQHGTTFGGNPVCCAAALAVLRTIADEGLLRARHAGRQGARRRRRGARAPAGAPGRRGRAAARHRADRAGLRRWSPRPPGTAGYLINNAVPDRLRLAPPLVLSDAQAVEFLPPCRPSWTPDRWPASR